MRNLPILPFAENLEGEQGYLAAASSQSMKVITELRRTVRQSFMWVWKNPDYTPAEMLAAMGNKAVANFNLHAAAVQLILTAGIDMPASEYTPTLAYTKNPDGTVTLD